MKQFAKMFQALDRTTSTNAKVTALAGYFACAPDDDRLWTIALLSGRRPRRTVTTTRLREWAAEAAGIPQWLFDEAYPVVGDLAETISLLLPPPTTTTDKSLSEWIALIQDLKEADETDRKSRIVASWRQLEHTERFLFNKLITGGFRVGVSQKLMTRALAAATGRDEAQLAHRIMGNWSPARTTFAELLLSDDVTAVPSRPYPFYLAHALDKPPTDLGEPSDWCAERKWDGIRGQLIIRAAQYFLWSRGEELITDRFPEFSSLVPLLPDGTAIDGEVLTWSDGRPLPFQSLQTRIGRKSVSRKTLTESPAVLMAYDLLEWQGKDIRALPFHERRAMLEDLAAAVGEGQPLRISPTLPFDDWSILADERNASRQHMSEGLMLKRQDGLYLTGRRKGDWWKWKVDPLTVDAVMIYAQAGHGRRANLYTDFTFAVWNKTGELVPFTKAYSGLTDREFREITAWVRRNTLERFGPVRRVPPEHVFEIAFEGIQRSTRHKSGIALRFPRISRWRRDKPIAEADTLANLEALLSDYERDTR